MSPISAAAATLMTLAPAEPLAGTSDFFTFQKETHLSKERVSVLMIYSLKVV